MIIASHLESCDQFSVVVHFYETTNHIFHRARQSPQEKQPKPTADVSSEIDNVVFCEEPPPYEFQTVSLDFGHDIEDGREIKLEMPAFNETNKVSHFFSTRDNC